MLHTERHYIWVMLCGTQRLLQHDLKVESESITSIASIPNMTAANQAILHIATFISDVVVFVSIKRHIYSSIIASPLILTISLREMRAPMINDQFTNKMRISVIYAY